MPDGCVGLVGDVLQTGLGGLDHGVRSDEQALASRRQRQLARGAVQERGAQALLQLSNMVAEHRGGESQRQRGTPK